MRNAVANNNKTLDYIDINPNTSFLIFEDEVEKYQQYGGGISHLICVSSELFSLIIERYFLNPITKWLTKKIQPYMPAQS